MDNNGNKLLDVDDFRWGLKDFGILISKEEAQQVLDHFDRDRNGVVDYNEFLRAIRVRQNPVFIILHREKLMLTEEGT